MPTTEQSPRCTTSCRTRQRALRWLELSLWRTWCPSWRSPEGSYCWSRLDRLWTTSSTNWSVSAELWLKWFVKNSLKWLFLCCIHSSGSSSWGWGYHYWRWQLWIQRHNSRLENLCWESKALCLIWPFHCLCLCPTAALYESETEGLAVCGQWRQWWRRGSTLWTLTHARRT